MEDLFKNTIGIGQIEEYVEGTGKSKKKNQETEAPKVEKVYLIPGDKSWIRIYLTASAMTNSICFIALVLFTNHISGYHSIFTGGAAVGFFLIEFLLVIIYCTTSQLSYKTELVISVTGAVFHVLAANDIMVIHHLKLFPVKEDVEYKVLGVVPEADFYENRGTYQYGRAASGLMFSNVLLYVLEISIILLKIVTDRRPRVLVGPASNK